MRRSRQRGFTLVELMVVVGIIAIVSALLVGVSGTTYGASSQVVADQLATSMNFVRMRAVSSRRIHEVEINPQEILIWQSDATGFGPPLVGYVLVQRIDIPNTVKIWNIDPVALTATGNAPAEDPSLNHKMYFKPDGSSTGVTIFLTNRQNEKQYRVLVYKATGSSYARETW